MKYGMVRGFMDVLVFNENKKFSKGARVNGMLYVYFFEGLMCLYKFFFFKLLKEIKGYGRVMSYYLELILNNFSM